MALPSISDYIVTLGSSAKNHQKLLGYYGEIYDFYNDKRPDNKYIYYLDENPYLAPAKTTPAETLRFFAATPLQLNLLTPVVRIFKVFQNGSKEKKIEFPFDNKMDFSSFEDPVKYIGNDPPFITDRFMGPVVGLKSVKIIYRGVGGKKVTPATMNAISVNLSMELQDPKMLFKDLHETEDIQYKDLIASPNKGAYKIIMEVGYGIPDNAGLGLEGIATKKLMLDVMPNAGKTNVSYNEDGTMSISTTLEGRSEILSEDINLLDPKYYKTIRQGANMLVVDNESEYSSEELKKKISDLDKLMAKNQVDKNKQQKNSSDKTQKPSSANSAGEIKKLEKEIDVLQRKAQLASQLRSVPPVFSFISALYELGKIYYLEMNNEQYKRYIKKIAQDEFVDLSKLNIVPKEKKSQKLPPEDVLDKTNEVVFSGGNFRIRKFKGDKSDTKSKFEKIKFFYFGDLLNVILNNKTGGGIGQDLDFLGEDAFSLLLGPTVFIKNKDNKKIYNIVNTPISMDMFLFELNKMIHERNLKVMNLRYFLGDFMKRFFDFKVLSGEKEKTGRDVQYYVGNQAYTLDEDTIDKNTKIIKNFAEHMGSEDTRKVKDFIMIKNVLYDRNMTKKARDKLNIPTIYLGGPDKGPLKTISYRPVRTGRLAELELAKQYNLPRGTKDSIGEDDSIMVTSKMAVNLELVGNPFLNLSDEINVDSRFVDGGFFQQKNNLLFFSGQYYIHKLEHSIDGNTWTTNYDAMSFGDLNSKTYKTSITETPPPADAALASEAKNNAAGAPNKDAKPADAEKTKPDKKKGEGTTSTPKKSKKQPEAPTGKEATKK